MSRSSKAAPTTMARVIEVLPDETLNLLQNKQAAEKKLAGLKKLSKRKAEAVLHDLLQEAQKAKLKVSAVNKASITPEITAKEFILAIRNRKFFFRGLVVTGDVDLSTLKNKNLTHLDLGNVTFKGTFNASGCKLKGINCQGAVFEKNAVFDGADMREINFKDAKFQADFHIDQKTKAGKRKRLLDSIYQSNARTDINRITFKLSDAAELPEIGFAHRELQTVSPTHYYATLNGTRPLVTVYVAGIALPDSESSSEVSRLLKAFEAQYQLICDQETVLKHFRGNIVDRLNKKRLSDAEKINAIVRHARREPGGRTDRALQLILPSFRPVTNSIERDSVNVTPILTHEVQVTPPLSIGSVSQSSSDRSLVSSLTTVMGSSLGRKSPALGKSPVNNMLGSPQSVSDKLRVFFDADNTLLVDKALQISDTFSTVVKNYVEANAEEKQPAMDAVLTAAESKAKTTISVLDVVASFSEESDQNKQKEMVALYLLLKASKPEAEEVALFEQQRDAAIALLNRVLDAPQDFLETQDITKHVFSAYHFVKILNGNQDVTVLRFQASLKEVEERASAIVEAFETRTLFGLPPEKLVEQQHSFSVTRHFLRVLAAEETMLLPKIAAAKKTLNAALSDFENSPYLFGEDDEKSKRVKDKEKVVCSYLFLKAVGETDAVATYDALLKNKIYPSYLHFALRPATERNGARKFRYNLAEELFIRSGTVIAADCLAVQSGQRGHVAGGAGLFRKETSLREEFEKDCLKRWANLSLSFLQQAGLVDSAIFDVVQGKMAAQPTVRDQDRLCMERIFYLEALSKREKFDDAIREAKAIKAGYAEQLTVQSDQENPLATLLDTVLSGVVKEIKDRVVTETKQMLSAHHPDHDQLLGKDDNHLLNKSAAICTVRGHALEELLTIVRGPSAPMRSDVMNMQSAIKHGVTNTYALKTIADSVLEGRPFDHRLLLALAPEKNYYSIVWVGEDGEKGALCNRIRDAVREENGRIKAGNGNLSRKDLLIGLLACIDGMKPISGLLTVPLKIDDVTSKLAHDDVVLMNRGAIGAQYVIQLVEKAFEPLWSYGPIKGAITRSEKGMAFADPNDPRTKSLITNPTVNFPKYEWTVMLHAALLSFRANLTHYTMTQDRNDYEKITSNFTQLIETLNLVREKIAEIGEKGKTFDTLILNEKAKTGVLAQVAAAHMEWVEYSAGVSGDANLSQCPEKHRELYQARPYTL